MLHLVSQFNAPFFLGYKSSAPLPLTDGCFHHSPQTLLKPGCGMFITARAKKMKRDPFVNKKRKIKSVLYRVVYAPQGNATNVFNDLKFTYEKGLWPNNKEAKNKEAKPPQLQPQSNHRWRTLLILQPHTHLSQRQRTNRCHHILLSKRHVPN